MTALLALSIASLACLLAYVGATYTRNAACALNHTMRDAQPEAAPLATAYERTAHTSRVYDRGAKDGAASAPPASSEVQAIVEESLSRHAPTWQALARDERGATDDAA